MLLAADFFVTPRFALDARVGFAFGNSYSTLNNGSFFPAHIEVGGEFFLTGGTFRPYIGLGVGYAQYSSAIDTRILVGVNDTIVDVNAYKLAGNVLVTPGIGAWLLFNRLAIDINLRALILIGTLSETSDGITFGDGINWGIGLTIGGRFGF